MSLKINLAAFASAPPKPSKRSRKRKRRSEALSSSGIPQPSTGSDPPPKRRRLSSQSSADSSSVVSSLSVGSETAATAAPPPPHAKAPDPGPSLKFVVRPPSSAPSSNPPPPPPPVAANPLLLTLKVTSFPPSSSSSRSRNSSKRRHRRRKRRRRPRSKKKKKRKRGRLGLGLGLDGGELPDDHIIYSDSDEDDFGGVASGDKKTISLATDEATLEALYGRDDDDVVLNPQEQEQMRRELYDSEEEREEGEILVNKKANAEFERKYWSQLAMHGGGAGAGGSSDRDQKSKSGSRTHLDPAIARLNQYTMALSEPLKKCVVIIRSLMRQPEAKPFCAPVDLAIYPTYRDVVRNPIDFAVIERKVLDGYSMASEFIDDVRLVFSNCRAFNPEHSHDQQIVKWADHLEAVFTAHLETQFGSLKTCSIQKRRDLVEAIRRLPDENLDRIFRCIKANAVLIRVRPIPDAEEASSGHTVVVVVDFSSVSESSYETLMNEVRRLRSDVVNASWKAPPEFVLDEENETEPEPSPFEFVSVSDQPVDENTVVVSQGFWNPLVLDAEKTVDESPAAPADPSLLSSWKSFRVKHERQLEASTRRLKIAHERKLEAESEARAKAEREERLRQERAKAERQRKETELEAERRRRQEELDRLEAEKALQAKQDADLLHDMEDFGIPV